MSLWFLKPRIGNTFAEDVLNILKKRKVTFHGCGPDKLEMYPDGSAKMWFYGHRGGMAWVGGIKVKGLGLKSMIASAKPETVADMIVEAIDDSRKRLSPVRPTI
jgi:hypothetical protein